MKYYLSGPMKGYHNNNYPLFEHVTQYFRSIGHNIVSPHEVDCQDSYEDYLREDIKLLLDCQAIIMLPGWTDSVGARLEFTIAQNLKLEIFYYNQMAELKGYVLLKMNR